VLVAGGYTERVVRGARRIGLRGLVEARLSGRAAWQAVVGMATGDDFTHAAAIAYYGLLSLFPCLLLLFAAFGTLTAGEAARDATLDFVFRYFPTQFDFLTAQLDALRATRVQVGLAGGVMLVWASLGVFSAVSTAVNVAWGVERRRAFLSHRLSAFLMLVSAGLLLLAAALLASAVQVVGASWFGGILAQFTWLGGLQSLVVRYAATILLIIAVGLVFYFVPNAKTRFRDVWAGAILTGLLWRLALWGFSFYVARAGQLQVIHGSITTVVVFLLWIYVSSVILIFGVQFTAAHARLRQHRAPTAPAAEPLS
jgi:membrane protein